ncbi:MAG TPA: hypothetical protein VF975_05425 [Thermoanaerobaculia bacterium]
MILRRIGAVLLGLIVAVIIVQAAEYCVHLMYPPPPGTNMRDMNAVKVFVATLPTAAFVIVLAGWLVATLVGTYVAARIARTVYAGYFIGGLLLGGGIANAYFIPQPVWFSVVSFFVYISMTLLGSRAARAAVPSPAG